MRRKYYNRDPKHMAAKFRSSCAECGAPIQKGEMFFFFPASENRKALCLKCGEEPFRRALSDAMQEDYGCSY